MRRLPHKMIETNSKLFKGRPPTSTLAWIFLCALFVIEAITIASQFQLQIAPFYPRSFDQLGFYQEAYSIISDVQSIGWVALFSHFGDSPTSAIFPLQGALLAFVAGPYRGSILSLNMLYLLAAQAVLFWTVQRRGGSGWIAVAILLCSKTVFAVAGGVFDFRIDFSALCLYGIFICLVSETENFSDLKMTVIASLVGAVLVATRFVTLAYVGVFLAAIFLALLLRIRRQDGAVRKLAHVALCGAIVLILAGPCIFAARHLIFQYYGVGHVLGSEAAERAREYGIHSTFDHIAFYPLSIWRDHLGHAFILLAALIMCGGAFALISPSGKRAWRTGVISSRECVPLILLAIVVPPLVLTIDISKSPVVGGIVTIPIALLLATLTRTPTTRFERIFEIGVVIGAIVVFVSHGNQRQHYFLRADLAEVNRLNAEISDYAAAANAQTIAFTRLDDFLNAGTISLSHVWQNGSTEMRPLALRTTLGWGIASVSPSEAIDAVRHSDVVVLTTDSPDRVYSFDRSIESDLPQIEEVTKSLFLLSSATIGGAKYRVYASAPLRLEGISEGWITSDGIVISVPRFVLKMAPIIVLEGRARKEWLPGPSAQSAGAEERLPVTFSVSKDRYSIRIDGTQMANDSGNARIWLRFDRYFIPSLLGIGDDTRKLVLEAPSARLARGGDNDGSDTR
jgi:hypothetical protein